MKVKVVEMVSQQGWQKCETNTQLCKAGHTTNTVGATFFPQKMCLICGRSVTVFGQITRTSSKWRKFEVSPPRNCQGLIQMTMKPTMIAT